MEAIVTLSKYFYGIRLEELKKNTKILFQNSRYSGRDSKLEPPE
jgi:hypothetical protein